MVLKFGTDLVLEFGTDLVPRLPASVPNFGTILVPKFGTILVPRVSISMRKRHNEPLPFELVLSSHGDKHWRLLWWHRAADRISLASPLPTRAHKHAMRMCMRHMYCI